MTYLDTVNYFNVMIGYGILFGLVFSLLFVFPSWTKK